MTEVLKSRNGRRTATIEGGRGSYIITLQEKRRYHESVRQRRATTKPEAVSLAKAWIGR